MKKQNKKQTSKMKLSTFIVAGAVTGAIALLFAFTPVPQNKVWTAPPTAEKETNPVASNAASVSAGKVIYKKSCIDCHGAKGKGDGPKSADLDKNPQDFTKAEFQKQTDGGLFWKISEGRKPMPSFKNELTREQRWQVINYIRTLGGKSVASVEMH